MRKSILLFASVMMLALGAWAQSSGDDEFTIVKRPFTVSVGVKGGVNYSLAGDPNGFDLGTKGAVGFQGGLAANLHFSDKKDYTPAGTGHFGVQLEALYSQRTLKNDIEDIKMNCFAIPVLAQFYVSQSFTIEAGATFTGVLSTSPKTMTIGNAQTGSTTLGLEKIQGYDIMPTVGIGYYHNCGFTASVRYNLGLSNLAKNFETKVSTAELSVGYLFKVYK